MVWRLFFFLLFINAAPATATDWRMIPSESRLEFSTEQAGKPIKGHFQDFDAVITFDPNNLDAATVRATIRTGSVDAGDPERNAALPTKTWFNSALFPDAIFESQDFRHMGGNRFEARGTLTIKGISHPLALPFTLDISDGRAHMAGSTKIARTNFNVGTGDFASGQWISTQVDISVTLVAEPME